MKMFISSFVKKILLISTLVLILSSCSLLGGSSEKTALSELKWTYAEKGIQLSLKAMPDLNTQNNAPHPVTVVIVQLSDPNTFNKQIASSSTLSQWLLAQNTPAGVLDFQRVFIQPNEQQTFQFARAQDAKFVGLLVGFVNLKKENVARLYQIGVDIDKKGFIVKKRTAVPSPLKISLTLGRDGLLTDQQSKIPPEPLPAKPKAGEISIQSETKNTTQTVVEKDESQNKEEKTNKK